MKQPTTQPWIEAGYELFAKEGPAGLKVELLARKVGKSKSSFYHLFADTDSFLQHLLDYHREQARRISAEAKHCEALVPDVIHLAIAIKTDLLFNRQLRIHRDKPLYQQYAEEAANIFVEGFMGVWAASLGLEKNPVMARNVMNLTVDNFLLKLSEETLTYDWMLNYLNEVRFVVQNLGGKTEKEE